MRLERLGEMLVCLLDSGVLDSAVLTVLASEEKLSLCETHTAASALTCYLFHCHIYVH